MDKIKDTDDPEAGVAVEGESAKEMAERIRNRTFESSLSIGKEIIIYNLVLKSVKNGTSLVSPGAREVRKWGLPFAGDFAQLIFVYLATIIPL